MKHLILTSRDLDGLINKVQYFKTGFERELGEVMKYEGVKMNVSIMGDSKNDVISAMNKIISKQNSYLRAIQKKKNAKEDAEFNLFMNNIIRDIWNEMN